ncbi:TPA: hypothetical protein HA316_05090, partial [Candidatus Micrarchaeota archaeon]|nr:hypothetical protein [Candidatus Micrarchaeota archaeon]
LSANEIKALYWGGVTGGNVLNSSLLAKNDNWLVEVALCDAIGCGTPANSSALAIINYAPNVSINLPANGIIANLNISVNYTYNDSEGTSGTCSLIVNGTVNST